MNQFSYPLKPGNGRTDQEPQDAAHEDFIEDPSLPAPATVAALNRLAMVAQKTPHGVLICDAERRIEWANNGFISMTGYKLAEIRGLKPGQFLFGEQTNPATVQRMEESLAQPQPFEGEIYKYRKDGQGYWAFLSVTPVFDENAALQGFISIESDVTERNELLASLEQSQEYYRALTEAVPDIIVILSPRCEILFINAAVQKMLGHLPFDLLGQPLSQIISEEANTENLPCLQCYLAEGQEFSSGAEVVARHANGQPVPMELSFRAFLLNDETYYSCVLRDITERKQAMEMLQQREQQAALKAEIGAVLATPQVSLPTILEGVASSLNELLNLAMTRIWTLNVETDTLELQASIGLSQAPVEDYHRIPVGAYKIGSIAQSRYPYITNDAIHDVLGRHEAWAASEHLTAFAAYPLIVEERLVGCMALFSCQSFSPRLFEVLTTVAEMIAQRIERQWLDDALAEAHTQLELRVRERTIDLIKANQALQNEINERNRIEQELQEAKEFFRSIINDLPNPVFVKDEEGRFTIVNSAFAALYGLEPDRMVGTTDYDYSSAEEAANFRADDLQVLQSRQQKLILEEKHTTYRGEVLWLQVTKRPLSLGANRPLYLLGISTDLTERKALENKLRHAHKLESIGQLAAGIAHEINTPTQYVGDNTRFVLDAYEELAGTISKFRAMLETARVGALTPETATKIEKELQLADVLPLLEEIPLALQQTLEGVGRIAQIVQSMKDFSHPGSNEKKAADLNKAIESTITVARNEWKYVADLETRLDDSLPFVPCLLGEFNQVILNMIVNAAHAIADVVGDGGEGKGKITITTQNIADKWAEIRVSDTGCGIPAAIQDRIFDPFFTTKDVGIGTGQGLAISHHVIVEKHQGQLSFETELGRGTTFIICLPLDLGVPSHAAAKIGTLPTKQLVLS